MSTERVRELNDAFRTRFEGNGVIALTMAVRHFHSTGKVIKAVQEFDAFNAENDPHGEHDFGAVEIRGDKFFFKIDYYDVNLQGGSEDPADPMKTKRVMTIMRADEY